MSIRYLPLCLLLVGCVHHQAGLIDHARIEQHGQPVTPEDFRAAIDQASLVCIGEQHDEPLHHDLQQEVLLELLASERSGELAVAMEMFQQRFQPLLDGYVRGEIDEAELLTLTDWERNWGYDASMYRALWRTAHDYGLPLIGLNTPRDVTRTVARHGLDALPAAVRASLPELVLDDADHQRFFNATMGDHGHGMSPNFYVAQVIWDETMAQRAALWLTHGQQRRIVIYAGNGHCHDSAIVRRVERRVPDLNGLSVLVKHADGALPPEITSDYVVTITPRPL